MQELSTITYWGNSLKDYLIAVAIIILAVIVFQTLKGITKRWIKRVSKSGDSKIGDLLLRMISRGILPLLYIIALYIAVNTLTLNAFMQRAVRVAMAVVTVFFVVRILIMAIRSGLEYYFVKQGRAETTKAMNGVLLMVKVTLWVFGLVFLLGNLGYDVGTILAGLGIGGIAIALAAQNIFSDVFAYFSILFDRPFDVGEFLIIGNELGTVTKVGIKTTRIQSLSGEELSYSNNNMLNQWIHNYSRMEKRRAVFDFYASYKTPAEKIELIVSEVKKIILEQEKVTLDRVHLFDFGEYGLHFQGVYYSMEPGYGEYRDKQQNINLSIMKLFKKEDIHFAYTTHKEVILQQEK